MRPNKRRYVPKGMEALAGRAIALKSRNIFMLPTRHGLMLALLVFVLLLAAINYGNGLVYVLCFWLASMALTSMWATHKNLLGIEVHTGPIEPVFAGTNAEFHVCLHNNNSLPRYGLHVSAASLAGGGETYVMTDLEPAEQCCVAIEIAAPTRGYITMPEIVIKTYYPLGLLYTWSRRIALDQRCLVYPAPGPARPFIAAPTASPERDHGHPHEGDDFVGVRDYAEGDSPRHIDWKAHARGKGLYTKRFGGAGRSLLWLDWEVLQGMDTEARLSQLTRWVMDAEHADMDYGLRIPGCKITPAHGETHRHACLKALALFEGS